MSWMCSFAGILCVERAGAIPGTPVWARFLAAAVITSRCRGIREVRQRMELRAPHVTAQHTEAHDSLRLARGISSSSAGS